jgi:hypothetical protein
MKETRTQETNAQFPVIEIQSTFHDPPAAGHVRAIESERTIAEAVRAGPLKSSATFVRNIDDDLVELRESRQLLVSLALPEQNRLDATPQRLVASLAGGHRPSARGPRNQTGTPANRAIARAFE